VAYTDGFNQAGFVASGLTYDATLRNLELIGEAATHTRTRFMLPIPKSPGAGSSPPETASFTGIGHRRRHTLEHHPG